MGRAAPEVRYIVNHCQLSSLLTAQTVAEISIECYVQLERCRLVSLEKGPKIRLQPKKCKHFTPA
jgi:hypothetical protein